jgi:hypothetical protein
MLFVIIILSNFLLDSTISISFPVSDKTGINTKNTNKINRNVEIIIDITEAL